jgi:hypothetical protein
MWYCDSVCVVTRMRTYVRSTPMMLLALSLEQDKSCHNYSLHIWQNTIHVETYEAACDELLLSMEV